MQNSKNMDTTIKLEFSMYWNFGSGFYHFYSICFVKNGSIPVSGGNLFKYQFT